MASGCNDSFMSSWWWMQKASETCRGILQWNKIKTACCCIWLDVYNINSVYIWPPNSTDIKLYGWGTQGRSWLRHCATSRKVADLIPDGAIGIFHWHNPSGRTMALGMTHPLTQISIRNISWGLRRPVLGADNLTIFMCRLSWNLGASTSWNPQGMSRPVQGLLYLSNLYRYKT
jgi:hypothetical protein